jgi:t-SNARE complex subunit (syntaxin)
MNDHDSHPDDLLPWYANDTLAGEERGRVEKHLKSCERCSQELALMHALRSSVKELGTADTPGELGRRRLMRQVKSSRGAARSWWRPALAAAAVVIVVQTVVLGTLLWPRESAITPLGGTAVSGTALLQVRFVPTATEAEIRAALAEVNGTIVDGPGALGVYSVRLAGIAATQAVEIENAVQRLRAQRQVVLQVLAE